MLTEPWISEMQQQAAMDRWAGQFPICDCCGARIYPGSKFYQLEVRKDALIVCEECASEMMDNPCYVEDASYGN